MCLSSIYDFVRLECFVSLGNLSCPDRITIYHLLLLGISLVAYTLGSEKAYDEALLNPPAFKIGKSEDYTGGWVWKTLEEAHGYRKVHQLPYAIYKIRLKSDWDSCTYQLGSLDYLIYDAEIISKVIVGTIA